MGFAYSVIECQDFVTISCNNNFCPNYCYTLLQYCYNIVTPYCYKLNSLYINIIGRICNNVTIKIPWNHKKCHLGNTYMPNAYIRNIK